MSEAISLPGAPPGEGETLQALRNAFKLGGSLVATWGVSLAVRILLPRALGPAGFGIYSFADAFSTTCFIALTLGLESYIHKEIPLRPGHASEFLAGVLVLRAAGAVLVALAMWGIVRAGGRSPEVQAVVLLFAALQLFSLNNDTFSALLHAVNRIDGLTVANVATKLLWGALLVSLALGHAGLLALAAASLGAEAVRSLWLGQLVHSAFRLRFRVDVRRVAPVLRSSLPFFVSAIAHTAYSKVDGTMLAFLSSDAEVGYYGAAMSLANLTLLLTPLIGWVLLPLTARAAARSQEELLQLLRSSLRVVLSLAIPIALALWLCSTDLVRLAFGPAFLPAALTLRVLAPLFVVTYVAILASTCLVRLDRAWTVTGISLAGLVLTPLLNLAIVPPALAAWRLGGGGAGASVALLLTELMVSAAMVISLRGALLSAEVLRSVGSGLGCALVVLASDRLWGAALGVGRYPLEAGLYLFLASASGALRLGELTKVTLAGLRRREAR